MENVISIASTAHVKFQTWGKIFAMNIRCFVENALLVVILLCKTKICVGKERIYCKGWVKGSAYFCLCIPCGIKKDWGNDSYKNGNICFDFIFFSVLLQLWFWRN